MTTQVRARKLIILLATWSLLAFSIACDFSANTGEVQPVTVTDNTELETGGGGGACDRLPDCCRDYIAEMGNMPATTCAAYENASVMGESTCESTMSGFRTGLQAMSKTVPSSCQ